MKMKRHLSILLASTMAFTSVNPMGGIYVKAGNFVQSESIAEAIGIEEREQKNSVLTDETASLEALDSVVKEDTESTLTENKDGEKADEHILLSGNRNNSEWEESDFLYETKNDGTLVITGFSQEGRVKLWQNRKLMIPATINGTKVTGIGRLAFRRCNLESVVLPKELSELSEYAFSDNGITTLTLPDTLTEIGRYAFSNNEIEELFIPNSVKKIGAGAFLKNRLTNNSVKIDNHKGKVELELNLFSAQKPDGSVVEPYYIRDDAQVKYDIKVVAPKEVQVVLEPGNRVEEGKKVSIKYTVLDENKELLYIKVTKGTAEEKVEVAEDNTFIMPRNDVKIVFLLKDKYSEDKWQLEDFTYLLHERTEFENKRPISIKEHSVSGFSEKGLEKLKKKKEVTLPVLDNKGEIIRCVYEGAFENKGITKLIVPENYVNIYDKAFKDNEISELVLSEGLKGIYNHAFANNKVKEFISPVTVEKIGSATFLNNDLTKVVLSDVLIKIGDESFKDNKISDLYLGNSIEQIGKRAFENNQLTEVNIPNSIKKGGYGSEPGIYDDAFDKNPGKTNPLNPKETKVLLWTPNKNNPKRLGDGRNFVIDPIPVNAEYLPSDFQCFKSKDKVKVRDFSESGEKKYKKSTSRTLILPLESINGEQVTGIAQYAFASVEPEIEQLIIPKGYTSIGGGAFVDHKLTKVKLPDTILEIANTAFENEDNRVVNLYVSSQEAADRLNAQKGKYWQIIVDSNIATDEWESDDFRYGVLKVESTDATGHKSEVNINAVTGFSPKGIEKLEKNKDLVLPKFNDQGMPVMAVADNAFSGRYGEKRLNTLTIPDGYLAIGNMAFAFNRCGGALVLPESMEHIGFSAFFRNEFESVVIPKKIKRLPVAMMKGNKLKNVIIQGNVTAIGAVAFSDNQLEEVNIPDSVVKIEEKAFTNNPGKAEYDDKVILRTKSKNNPQKLEDKENYLVDPKENGTTTPIDHTNWTVEDFKYADQMIIGFSQTGLRKIKRNKNVTIPEKTANGKELLVIGVNAFGNDNKGYHIEKVVIPDTVTEIRSFAFQYNDISEIKLPKELVKLGNAVFLMTGIEKLVWNEKVETIGESCFLGNRLGKLELPQKVHSVMDNAFRNAGITELVFADRSDLKIIGESAFADNKISKLELPDRIEVIDDLAFANIEIKGKGNQLTEITVPNSLKKLGLKVFAGNTGNPMYKRAVVVNTIDGKNPNSLVDDTFGTYVVDPEVKADETDRNELKKEIEEAEKIKLDKLTSVFRGFFKKNLDTAKEALKSVLASKTHIKALTKDLVWARERAKLNMLMFEKEELESKQENFPADKWEDLESAYNDAKLYLMVVNISDTKLKQVIRDLRETLAALEEKGSLAGAKIYEGEAKVNKTKIIKFPYTVKVKVWLKNGNIVLVRENGIETEDIEEHEEHNASYLRKAIELLYHYTDKDIELVKNNYLKNQELGINAISGATVSSITLHRAIQDALKKANSDSPAPHPEQPQPPVNPNPQPEQPQPPVNPNPQPEQPKPPVNPNPEVMIPPSNGDLSSPGGTASNSGGTLSNDEAKTETKIEDEKTPLANIPTETKALVLNNKKMVRPTDKQLSDVIAGKYTYIELIVGAVSLKLMPKDVKALFKEGKGKSYLKVGKSGKEEIKKLNLKKKISEKDIFKPELMISGKKVTSFKKKISIKLDYKGVIKTDTVMILLADSNKMIKAKYNKETKTIEFKTNKLGTFVIMK